MPHLTAKLYTWPDLTTVVADFDTVAPDGKPIATDLSVVRALGDAGTGSVTLPLAYTDAFAWDGSDVISLFYGGRRVMTYRVPKWSKTLIGKGGGAAKTVTLSGTGPLSFYDRAVIFPTINIRRAPTESDRFWGWQNYFFEETEDWVPVEDYGSIDDLALVHAFLLGQDPDDIRESYRNRGIPDLTVLRLYWAPGYSILSADPGYCYFRDGLFVPAAGDYDFVVYADDACIGFYVDGQVIVQQSGISAFDVTRVTVTLSVGFHQLAFLVYNDPTAMGGGGLNGGYVGYAVYTTVPVTIFKEGDEFGTLVQQMNGGGGGDAVVLAYPETEPGIKLGRIVRLAHEEAALGTWQPERTAMSVFALTFDDDVDSGGTNWPGEINVAHKTGLDMATWFTRELGESYGDFFAEFNDDTETLELSLWVKGGRGSAVATEFVEGVNLQEFTVEGENDPVNAYLISWDGGWDELVDETSIAAVGRHEDTIEIGSPASLEEVYRVVGEQLAANARIREEWNAVIVPTEASDTPFDPAGFQEGDTITTPVGDMRVQVIALNDSGDHETVVTVTLQDVILNDMERIDNAIRKGL